MHWALRQQIEKLKGKKKKAPKPKPVPVPPKPKATEPSKLWKKVSGRFVCLLCDHDLGTQKGIENHIESKHPEE